EAACRAARHGPRPARDRQGAGVPESAGEDRRAVPARRRGGHHRAAARRAHGAAAGPAGGGREPARRGRQHRGRGGRPRGAGRPHRLPGRRDHPVRQQVPVSQRDALRHDAGFRARLARLGRHDAAGDARRPAVARLRGDGGGGARGQAERRQLRPRHGQPLVPVEAGEGGADRDLARPLPGPRTVAERPPGGQPGPDLRRHARHRAARARRPAAGAGGGQREARDLRAGAGERAGHGGTAAGHRHGHGVLVLHLRPRRHAAGDGAAAARGDGGRGPGARLRRQAAAAGLQRRHGRQPRSLHGLRPTAGPGVAGLGGGVRGAARI
ncbi:MAG: BUG/TctC family periplasmic protein, partial [uncultured Acetobacteraceae bacterium]